MNLTIKTQVRLTPDAQQRQPDIGHAVGTVIDTGGGAVKVCWTKGESWHKPEDLDAVEA